MVPSWQRDPAHYDTILVSTNQLVEGMQGLDIAHVHLFFSFTYDGQEYPCALVDWYDLMDDKPDDDMDMWIVKPIADSSGVIHLDTIMCCSYLLQFLDMTMLTNS